MASIERSNKAKKKAKEKAGDNKVNINNGKIKSGESYYQRLRSQLGLN